MYVTQRRVLKRSAQLWFDRTVLDARAWKVANHWQCAQGKVIVWLWYYFPDRRRRDTHNTLKILLDAFEDGGIYEDDKFAMPRVMDYEVDEDHPRIEIEFERVAS
jgi:crossover junction endodeoxyribonuclease RusA